ncbi:MAG: VWA domain-containing protein [Phycisphaerales bacterium]|nr:VWA domain-containing protein [Phycisphaerales bacterium]MCI0677399.1 VWA domain-containing protein [Phycisphaerales bacterium]
MPAIRFDHPQLLLLALIAVPLILIGWRAMSLTDPLRRWVALALRAILIVVFAIALARPHMVREHDHLTVIGVLDISGSVQRFANLPPISLNGSEAETRSNIAYLRQWFRTATQTKEADDRFGLIVFDGKAAAISAPTRGRYVDDNLDVPIAQGTNIADALHLALAMFPPDSAKRIVLVTDGNETAGNVIEAIKQVGPKLERSAVPIDVLPIAYRITGDVQVARVEAPPTAQPGQVITIRIILESASAAQGTLTLRREGVPVDLNGLEPGNSRAIAVGAGTSVHPAQVALGETPVNRFEAIFEADDPEQNMLPDNDRAEAFTATPSKGSALVVSSRTNVGESGLAQILNDAGVPAKTQPPFQVPDDLLSLQNYDLIVLDNIAAAELTQLQQDMLVRYVNDLGGGLIMTGGDNSFGAGGWNGTGVENILPLELDPPKELRLPTAALVLVLDKSGSMNMPVAGARASQQEVANEGAALAIESLRSDSMVGVVTFDTVARTTIPLQANDDPRRLAQIVRQIRAEGGTNLEPGLRRAQAMLKDVKVAKKRVVCMSDGRSQTTENLPAIAQEMAAGGIQVSAIAVGDEADHETMRKIAEAGGGEFYAVRDPRTLPRVLVESVQVMNKPLIKEGPFVPRVLPTGSTLTGGMEAAPQLDGLVITSPRNDPKAALEMVHPDGEPLLAHWQAGLGRVAAFTSSSPGGGAWANRWSDWPTGATFWTQLARTIARPATSQDAELRATIQDDRLTITLDTGSGSLDEVPQYIQVDGTVYLPDGTTASVRLRQTAPGQYQTQVDARLAGNYIIALNPRQGSQRLAPVIGGVSRSTSPEFRRYASNLALLEEIVQSTGGRRLDVANPLSENLFDRSKVPPSVSFLPAWRTIVIWILALLLIDVACRRLAWDYNLLRSTAQRLFARAFPSQVRGAEAAATLASLRRVSDEVESRTPHRVARGSSVPNEGESRFDEGFYEGSAEPASVERVPKPVAPVAAPSEPAEPSKVAAALDALLGRSSTPKADVSDSATVEPDPSAPARTTGSLLAAKRRARQRLDDGRDQ